MTSAPLRHALRTITTLITLTVPPTHTGWHLFKATEQMRFTPEVIGRTLQTVREQPERWAELAGQAYRHSNGFVKIKVAETHGLSVRLHIWPAGENRMGDVDPHSHRWEFASWIAVGEGIYEQRFKADPRADEVGDPYVRFIYGRRSGASFLEPTEIVSLRPDVNLIRTPGHVYGCSLDVIHTVAPIGNGLVATVVVQGPVKANSAQVYRRPGQSGEDRRSPIPAAELDQLLAEVEDDIRARAGGSREPVPG